MANIPEDINLPEAHGQYGSDLSVLIITADKVEDLEFFYPYYRFIEAGCKVDVVTPDGGEFKGKNGMKLSESKKITDVTPENYDLLYVPGGKAPAALRENDAALDLTRRFAATGKPIAAICHGPQLLAAADVIRGKTLTAYPECEVDVRDGEATYVNKELVEDGQFITSRWPGDLPVHLKRTLEILQEKKWLYPQGDPAQKAGDKFAA